jgi:drug/metabolite transporter (DMT)-like permease
VLRSLGRGAPTAGEWRGATLAGLPLVVLGMGGIAVSVARVPSGLVALVMASVPLWMALLDRLWGGRLSASEVLGVLVGAAGVLLVSVRGALGADRTGALVVVFAAACYALGCVLTRRLAQPKGLLAPAAQMLVGGVVLLIGSAAVSERASTPTAASVAALVYVTALGTLFAYSVLSDLLRNARPALATSYTYVNPVIALLLGATLGREPITASDVVGLVLVIAAVGLIALRSAARPGKIP